MISREVVVCFIEEGECDENADEGRALVKRVEGLFSDWLDRYCRLGGRDHLFRSHRAAQ